MSLLIPNPYCFMSLNTPAQFVPDRYSKVKNESSCYVLETLRGLDINRVFAGEMGLLGATSLIAKKRTSDMTLKDGVKIDALEAFLKSENLSYQELLAKVAVAMFAEEALKVAGNKQSDEVDNMLVTESGDNDNDGGSMGEITHAVYTRMLVLTSNLCAPSMSDAEVKTAFLTFGQIVYTASGETDVQQYTTAETSNSAPSAPQGLTTMQIANRVLFGVLETVSNNNPETATTTPQLVSAGREGVMRRRPTTTNPTIPKPLINHGVVATEEPHLV